MTEEHSVQHLTRVNWWVSVLSWPDRVPVLNLILGRRGALWMPPLIAAWIGWELSRQAPRIGLILLLVAVEVAVLATTSAAHEKRTSDAQDILLDQLRSTLDWLHRQAFNGRSTFRPTIMVPVRKGEKLVLRVFLRPRAFPSLSLTSLVIDNNSAIGHGVAGRCFINRSFEDFSEPGCGTWPISQYAAESGIPEESVKQLSRRSDHYIAFPLEGTKGQPLGVLVVDSTDDPFTRTMTDRVKFLAGLFAQNLDALPDTVRRRA